MASGWRRLKLASAGVSTSSYFSRRWGDLQDSAEENLTEPRRKSEKSVRNRRRQGTILGTEGNDISGAGPDMPNRQMNGFFRHLRRAALRQDGADLSDGQ